MTAETPGQAAYVLTLPELLDEWRDTVRELDAKPFPDDKAVRRQLVTEVSVLQTVIGQVERAIAAAPQPAPGAKAPDRPVAKFYAWMASQGYPSPDGRYDGDEMCAAFEGGMTSAVVAYAGRPERSQPAPELAAAMVAEVAAADLLRRRLAALITGWRAAAEVHHGGYSDAMRLAADHVHTVLEQP